jgi:DNA polymerase-3 subunit epsilon
MYAIVDIETTGGSATSSRITEIAIFLFDGQKVVDEFTTLINPECYIPPMITNLTGITNKMVANAPKFFEVARRIAEITEGATFVAHNVQFDYRFVQAEFKRLGFDYTRNTLCTVRLSRKHIPGYPSYSLGNLCSNLGISISGRHRASGDALATVKLFEKLLAIAPDLSSGIENSNSLPPNLKAETISSLPESTGVYFLYNSSGDIIYIGKSVNIRKRVLDHTSRPTTKRAAEMLQQIADIGFEVTGSELIALIVEADSIKKHLPKYNKRGRRANSYVGLYSFIDSNGYINLLIDKVSAKGEPLTTFDNADEAQSYLYRLVSEYDLCQKLCGLYKSNSACFHHQIGQCKGACVGQEPSSEYNYRASRAINSIGLGSDSFLLIDRGRNNDEKSFVKVVNGSIEGFGYFNPDYIGNSANLLSESVTPCGNHRDALMVVRSFLRKPGIKVVGI